MNERNAGRKKKSDSEKRNHKITFYLNEDEYKTYLLLKSELAKSQKPISIKDYLRFSIVSYFLKR